MARLILASTSRYRRELLGRLGLPFATASPAADESSKAGEPPAALAERLAVAKARSVVAPDAVVIGADQVASLHGERLRKPGGHEAALRQLLACQGKIVVFHTAVMVLDHPTGRSWSHVDRTDVHFATLGSAALDRYLKLEQPYDCAGSFKAEGLGVALFERVVCEDPTALIGLPLIWLARTLTAAGLDPLALNEPLAASSTR
jgi:septum formation protein